MEIVYWSVLALAVVLALIGLHCGQKDLERSVAEAERARLEGLRR